MDGDGDCKTLLNMRLAQPDASMYFADIIHKPELLNSSANLCQDSSILDAEYLVSKFASLVISGPDVVKQAVE